MAIDNCPGSRRLVRLHRMRSALNVMHSPEHLPGDARRGTIKVSRLPPARVTQNISRRIALPELRKDRSRADG